MKQLKQTTNNLEPAFRDYGNYLKRETEDQFHKEIDPDGKPWQPLSPYTIARKKTIYKLRETFDMFNSIYFKSTKNQFEFGIKDWKYKFHHFGTVRMPARRVIGMTKERMEKLNKFIINQIRRVKLLRAKRRRK